MTEQVTVTITADGDEDELRVPRKLLELLSEGEAPPSQVVGDVALMSLANRIHHMSHHQEGEPDEELSEIESETLDRFEERFGVTFAEATGHSH